MSYGDGNFLLVATPPAENETGGADDVRRVLAAMAREFLMAGIFAQTVIFGSTITGTGLAQDIQRGIPPPDVWPLENAVLASLLWIVLQLIFVPVSISRYKVAVNR